MKVPDHTQSCTIVCLKALPHKIEFNEQEERVHDMNTCDVTLTHHCMNEKLKRTEGKVLVKGETSPDTVSGNQQQ